ncbi:ferredoxin [Agromyces archimandritae]|uniref:Ferredoxin n=1 Tax=Agromyces archimandritae TaxID=2781962 RepID=A0A975IPV4_9MICO|nr:ferredoxin [Agromyces archimandritae]QTX04386.1 ferredoxin [Agromyces archimandritae]
MPTSIIIIDQARCEGYGFCAEAAPVLLELDDDGILHTRKDVDGDDELERAEAAVRVCPVAALRIGAGV